MPKLDTEAPAGVRRGGIVEAALYDDGGAGGKLRTV